MTLGGISFLAGTGLVASAFETPQLVVGRVVLGFGVGFATQAVPLYLSEMAPCHLRGALSILFQLAITIGIVAAQLINYGTQFIQPWGWRLSLALGAVPAVLFFGGSLVLPDTTNSAMQRGQPQLARSILERIRGTSEVDAELEDMREAVAVAASIQRPYTAMLQRRYWPQLTISVLIPIFQQWTGIAAIMFYAPQLFQSLGAGTDTALFNTVVIGTVNMVSTVVSILTVDRLERKALFLEGGVQMIVFEMLVGSLIAAQVQQPENEALAGAILAFICIFVAGFACHYHPEGGSGQGGTTQDSNKRRNTGSTGKSTRLCNKAMKPFVDPAVDSAIMVLECRSYSEWDDMRQEDIQIHIAPRGGNSTGTSVGHLGWLVPSEVQPLETRSAGTAINTTTNFLMTFIIGQCFLSMLCAMEYGVFYFFAAMVLLMTAFTMAFVPETRGVPIDEVEEVLIGRHWFWRKVLAGARREGGGAAGVGAVLSVGPAPQRQVGVNAGKAPPQH